MNRKENFYRMIISNLHLIGILIVIIKTLYNLNSKLEKTFKMVF